MSPINGFIIISLLATLCYFGALISFLTDYETGKCEMTYMFEYPQFVRISNPIDDRYKKYGLYAYSEGRLTEKARNMYFEGIPVLFIPGSAGSHKQVRSLASIALRKALNSRTQYHFNYFTVDLNNELSGLNGALLGDQLDYVNHSIYQVLQLYEKRKNPPKSIVLIGHSMGGIIAKALITKLPDDSDLIPLVITLSSPLKRPVVALDYYFEKFYNEIDFEMTTRTTFISIAGGYNDFLVPAYLTEGAHLDLVATSVPKCWVSTDHLSVLWCKQLVLAINRALFESVDPQYKQISNDHDRRLSVFKHHLIKHSGTRTRDVQIYNSPISINNEGEWFESIYRQYSVRLPKGTREYKWYMFPILMNPKHEYITIVALNMKAIDWVFACPAISMRNSRRVCDVGRHLTQFTEISPSNKYKRRSLRINMFDLKRNYSSASHVVVRVLPTDEPVVLHFDVHGSNERSITINNPPKWYSFSKQMLIEETEEKAIDYEIILPHLNHIMQSYALFIEPTECSAHGHHATASLIVPWNNHDMHDFITEVDKTPIVLRLYKSRPVAMANESAVVRLTLDPTCRYKISVKNSMPFGNIARFYSPLLVANIAAVILMTLRSQLKNISDNERCSIFFTAIKEGAKPYYIVTVIKILSKIMSSKVPLKLLPMPDGQLLIDENLDFLILPLVLYLISVGVVWILAIALSISFICFESTVHKLVLKFFSKTFSGRIMWTDHIMKAFEKIPGVIAAILIFMSFTTCGGLALCLATVFYFLKLTQMAQDFIEDLVKSFVKSIAFKLTDKIWIKIKEKWWKRKGNEVKSIEEKKNPAIECKVGDSAYNHEAENKENNERCKAGVSAQSNDNKHEKITGKNDESKENLENKNIQDELNRRIEKLKSSEDLEQSDDELKLEKPMEIEFTSADNPGVVHKVSGDKLVELLTTTSAPDLIETTEDDVTEHNSTTTQSKPESVLDKIDISWIKEIMENNEIFFHFTIFMLYFIVASLNIPSTLTWAHNFKYNKHLEPDPALIPGVILSICAVPLWQFEFPRVDRQFYKELSHLVYGAAAISLLYGVVSIYRLSFILSAVVAMVTLHQLFAIKKPEVQIVEEVEHLDNLNELYNKTVKAKLE